MAIVRWLPALLAVLAFACSRPPAQSQPDTTPHAPRGGGRAGPALRSVTASAVVPPVFEATAVGSAVEDADPPRAEARTLREPLAEPDDTRALVLMYHSFDRGSADLTVDGWQFKRQLTWLRDNHIEIVTTSELVAFLRGERKLPARVAIITIDDGDKSVYKVAWPILRRLRVPFTLALPTKLMQENKKHRMLSWDQVREMIASGLCEVGSHGHEHKSIIYFSDDQAVRELTTSRRILERETGMRPTVYFYPLGSFDERTSALVEKVGYRAAFKATGAPVGLDCCNLYAVPRVGIIHRDTIWTLGWYYSPSFLDQMMRLGRR